MNTRFGTFLVILNILSVYTVLPAQIALQFKTIT